MGADPEDVRRLMKEGLDHFALGDAARAIACWREVLARDPEHTEARDYLRAAEGDAAAPGTGRPAAGVVEEALALLRRGEPAEAAALLQTVVGDDPDALEAHACLEGVRARLVGVYRERVGSGSSIPRVVIPPEQVLRFNLPPRAGFLLSQVDGTTSVDDLLALSGMDPLEALRALAGLLDAGIVEARAGRAAGTSGGRPASGAEPT